ncbi:hypothetical protein [Aliiruegeria lutimaris]|uniref:Phosphoadenosine phosphosulfate reductase n=1 Tax=Aliiruegeria lutimaris TaxID=571298 RepID=A0A1G8U9H2_9RHOB|nr:hypothetical protein [Aliiruegeria lutimaris]SDJ49640.1 hypothetical protein SAMN04488026_101873 [Aliiruegeria lutimaris]
MEMIRPPTTPAGPQRLDSDLVQWRERLDAHGELHGYHRVLDSQHGALFTEDDDILLVSFEPAEQMRAGPTGLPAALGVAGRAGWSQLCLYCEGDSFFRSEAVFGFFDELVDNGFFDRFDHVVFTGAGPCGYAAASYSVTAPGASVVLIRPLATLDPARAGWDHRYPALRRTDFTNRYGYAPQMLEAASAAFILFDPEVPADAIHASLFNLPPENLFQCRHFGPALERDLAQMGILDPLLLAAGREKLDSAAFHRLFRKRQEYRPYLHRVLNRLRSEKRAGLCRHWANGIRAQLTPEAPKRAASGG